LHDALPIYLQPVRPDAGGAVGGHILDQRRSAPDQHRGCFQSRTKSLPFRSAPRNGDAARFVPEHDGYRRKTRSENRRFRPFPNAGGSRGSHRRPPGEGRRRADPSASPKHPLPPWKVPYSPKIEEAIRKLDKLMAEAGLHLRPNRRWLALMWLEGNRTVRELLGSRLPPDLIERTEQVCSKCRADLDQRIRNARYALIEKIVREVTRNSRTADGPTWSDRLDRLLLHPVIGIPVFLLLMYLVFQLTFSWVGTPLSDHLDSW